MAGPPIDDDECKGNDDDEEDDASLDEEPVTKEPAPTNVDIWWSALKPQYQFKRAPQEHDSISTAQDTSVIDVEEFCEACCTKYCPCFGACRDSFPSLPFDGASSSSRRNQAKQIHCRNLLLACFASAMLCVCLYTKSTIVRRWFVNVGLTRRIDAPSFLSRDMTVTTAHEHFPKSELYVFRTGRHCPPLSPTPVTLENGRIIHFGRDGVRYEYDYFYLNQGSMIHLKVSQTQGSSDVYLLHGQNIMERIVNDPNQDNQGGFEKLAIDKRSLSVGDMAQVLDFTVTKADDYIVVYEDTAPGKHGRLVVDYTVHATTYNVKDAESICDDPLGDCTIPLAFGKECIIVQSKPDADQSFGKVVMFVTTKSEHRILLILLLSSLPIVVAQLIHCVCRLAPRHSYEPIDEVMDLDELAPSMSFRDNVESSPVGIKFLGKTFISSQAQSIPILKSFDGASDNDPVIRVSPSSIVHV